MKQVISFSVFPDREGVLRFRALKTVQAPTLITPLWMWVVIGASYAVAILGMLVR